MDQSPAHPTIKPKSGVLAITPYVGGEASVAGANRVRKLSANENPHGPSPAAKAAYLAAGEALGLYPEGGAVELRAAIAEMHGLDAERVVCGAGSDELIALLCQAYAGEGDEVLHSAHGFLMYKLSALAANATPVTAPERDLTADIDALIAAMTPRTRLVFLANPNNPTGTMVPAEDLGRLADALPAQALLVIDGAYAEYVWRPRFDAARSAVRAAPDDPGLALAGSRGNVVMTRTFSKIHGLGALRLGWAYGPAHVIDVLNRVRGPFNVTAPALAAGEAAMRDQAYVLAEAEANEAARDGLAEAIRAAGLRVVPSMANFILVEAGDKVAALDDALRARGLIARRVDGYGLPGYLRISIGTEEDCAAVAEAVNAFTASP
ncbi:MAG: histidinol-phosphate transaminase [Pseudomonadota bacterium]